MKTSKQAAAPAKMTLNSLGIWIRSPISIGR